MKILGVIPARYASTRFPGKPLIEIEGKTMINRVYLQCKKVKTLDRIIVATDDDRIYRHVISFGEAQMTSPEHQSGTDRCQEVVASLNEHYDYVINIQGDEPFIDPQQIELLISLLDGRTPLATLAKLITNPDQIQNPNVVKVVITNDGQALYFSRSPIPYLRNINTEEWLKGHPFYKHIGLYAYHTDVLAKITTLKTSSLEKAEALEQLRWLENGFKIKVAITTIESAGIDTPDDLKKIIVTGSV